MKKLAQVTVIVAILNEEKNIINCIKSIKRSGIKKIIVVDGGSTDQTLKKLRDLKIKFFQSKKGLGYQRNLGIRKTKTKYAAFIDADHRPTKKYFLLMRDDLVNSNYAGVQPRLITNKKNMSFFEKSYQYINNINVNILGSRKVIGTPVLWNTKIIKKINYNIKITAGSDYTDLCFRLHKKRYTFGGSKAKIKNINRLNLMQYINKYFWYGKGDAQFIINHPERFLKIIYHQLINYPIKYSLFALSDFKIFPIPLMIFAGILRFTGMNTEFFRKLFNLKEKIYST